MGASSWPSSNCIPAQKIVSVSTELNHTIFSRAAKRSHMKMYVSEKQTYKNAGNHKNFTKSTSELHERAIN